jgi:integrase
MAITFNDKTKLWDVSFSKRHPITRKPYSLKRIGIASRAEAKRVYDQLVIQLHEKLKETIVPRWRDLVPEFIQASLERGLGKHTMENYELCLRAHTFSIWKDRLVDSVTPAEITDLIKVKLANRSPSHQKNLLKYVRAAFNYALEKGYINRSPVPQLKFRIGDKLKAVLTLDQARTFLEKAKEMDCEWYPHWCLALYTGMRNSELYALTWDKVDLENRKIWVTCSWTKKDGYKDFTKSGEDRILEIAPHLSVVLKELKLKSSDSTYVLPRIDKWDKGEQARELRIYLMGLGLPRLRFHDLRASWCTIMLSMGVEPIKVMKMGGWKDLKTMQIYMRKAGVDIKGITDHLEIHNPSRFAASILRLKS